MTDNLRTFIVTKVETKVTHYRVAAVDGTDARNRIAKREGVRIGTSCRWEHETAVPAIDLGDSAKLEGRDA